MLEFVRAKFPHVDFRLEQIFMIKDTGYRWNLIIYFLLIMRVRYKIYKIVTRIELQDCKAFEIVTRLVYNFSVTFSGVQLHDACESMGLTRRHLYSLITATREVPGGAAFGVRISGPPLLGKIQKLSSMNSVLFAAQWAYQKRTTCWLIDIWFSVDDLKGLLLFLNWCIWSIQGEGYY